MKDSFFDYLALVTQLGIFVCVCILSGLFIGIFLDKIINTKILFTIVFLIFGIVAAFLGSWRLIKSKSLDG